jgi:hypothetical protein
MGILRAQIQRSLERDFKDDPDWAGDTPQPGNGALRSYDFYFSERELIIINLFSVHALQGLWARIPFSDIVAAADPYGPLFKLIASRNIDSDG